MTNKDIYKIWAPAGRKWVDWVRPVPFISMKENSKGYSASGFSVPVIEFDKTTWEGAAVIVDLPGVESVEKGIALAGLGYRPIPIYNGTIEQAGARATVDNHSIGIALAWGATELCKMEMAEDALPAFLLDSNRLHRFKMEEALFDNSWDVYPQDLPSADYFINQGIDKIIIVGEKLSKDLKKILYQFQKKKMQIFLTNGYDTPKKITIYGVYEKDF